MLALIHGIRGGTFGGLLAPGGGGGGKRPGGQLAGAQGIGCQPGGTICWAFKSGRGVAVGPGIIARGASDERSKTLKPKKKKN